MVPRPRLRKPYLLATPWAKPFLPPPFPGQGRGSASCYLIFSAIPFAQLYLTRSTPPRRSLGHRILHIATLSCPPSLGGRSPGTAIEGGVGRGCGCKKKTRPKTLCHLSGPSGKEGDSAAFVAPVCQSPVGIPPCEGEGRTGSIQSPAPPQGFSEGKHGIHFLLMHGPEVPE